VFYGRRTRAAANEGEQNESQQQAAASGSGGTSQHMQDSSPQVDSQTDAEGQKKKGWWNRLVE
jgi:hypothetical protein